MASNSDAQLMITLKKTSHFYTKFSHSCSDGISNDFCYCQHSACHFVLGLLNHLLINCRGTMNDAGSL